MAAPARATSSRFSPAHPPFPAWNVLLLALGRSQANSDIQPVSPASLRGDQGPGPIRTPPRSSHESLLCPQLHAGAVGETGNDKEGPGLQGNGSLFRETKFIITLVHGFQLYGATSPHELISFSQPFGMGVITHTSQTEKWGSER